MVAAAANYGASLILQCSGDIGLGGLESRHGAEDDAGENGDGEVKEKNAKIGRAGNIHAAGIGGEIDFHKGALCPKGEREASESAEVRERKALDQELADDARTPRAHGQTNAPFLHSP